MSRWMPKLAFWLACTTVAVLSLVPTAHLPSGLFDWWDKAQHALAFAVLCSLGLVAHPARGRTVIVGLLAFAAGIEVAQAATGWRVGELTDLLADTVGLALGWLVWTRLGGRPARARS